MKSKVKEAMQIELKCSGEQYDVIYLDDEEDLLDVVSSIIEEYGFKCYSTTDSEQALEFLIQNKSKIACIISDFKMPNLNGFEFRERVSQISPQTPFSILSGHVDREMALRGLELKISGFIDKPVNVPKLEEFLGKEVLTWVRNLKEEQELLNGFIEEASTHLENAEEIALNLEQDPTNLEHINKLFGLVHTIKGTSGFFEPKTLSRFSHKFEDTLKKIQRREISLNPELVSGILRSLDVLKELLTEFQANSHKERDLNLLISEIFDPKPSEAEVQKVSSPGVLVGKGPSELKVSVQLLDEFVSMSGEMTVIRNMINKCVKSIERRFGSDSDVQLLGEFLEELHKVNGNVQAKVADLRKVGMKSLYKPLPRTVRDLTKNLKKEAELELIGENLRVDNTIAEALSQSLIHIVRNSVDHGLESPEIRLSLGKSRVGKIRIATEMKNENIIVTIQDDGNGIDPERIKQKLLKNGTHTDAQLRFMQRDELFQMIFSSGFSTAEKVTDVSGRGVGMAMVKDVVEALGGRIAIESAKGSGSIFTLTIPVPKSVLIKNCLFVGAGQLEFALPQDDILRVVRLSASEQLKQVFQLEGARVLKVDDEIIPIVSAHSLLGLEDPFFERQPECLELVIITDRKLKMALIIDRVGDIEDAVIKPVHGKIKALGVYLGATFYGDGGVALVLSAEGLIAKAGITVQELKTKELDIAHKEIKNERADRLSSFCTGKSWDVFNSSRPNF